MAPPDLGSRSKCGVRVSLHASGGARCSARTGASTTHRVPPRTRQLGLRPTAREGAGGQLPRPWPVPPGGRARSVDGVTPRQACPWPQGLGRNLRSKTRWFTGFCNSHQISHFATFFIDARAEISVAESHSRFCKSTGGAPEAAWPPCVRAPTKLVFLGAHRAGGVRRPYARPPRPPWDGMGRDEAHGAAAGPRGRSPPPLGPAVALGLRVRGRSSWGL